MKSRVPAGSRDIDFILSPGGVIYGKVTRKSDSSPASGIGIIAEPSGSADSWSMCSTMTDNEGNYELIGIPFGKTSIVIFTSRSHPFGETIEVHEKTRFDIVLAEGVTISGLIKDSSTLEPIENASVTLAGIPFYSLSPEEQKKYGATTNSSGKYTS